jgi:predicted transposase/invertase (TIGR01784 family)
MRLGIDPKVDIAFKKLFGREDNVLLLIDLLRAFVHPPGSITGLEMALPQAQKDTQQDKQPVADVRAVDQGNRQFQVEMQWLVTPFFPKRLLYYWAKFHAQQMWEGDYYQTLRPTISICFTNQPLFADLADYYQVFRVQEVKHGQPWTDDLEIHLVELPKFGKTAEQLSTGLDRWCYFFRHGAELDRGHLPPSLDVPPIRQAMEVLTVFTQDQRERFAYEERLMAQRDQKSLQYEVELARGELRQAIEAREAAEKAAVEAGEQAREAAEQAREAAEQAREAAEQARETAEKARETAEKAREAAEIREMKGIEKGTLIGQVRAFQEVLKQQQTPEAALAALPEQDLAALVAQLRRQLTTNGN